MGKIQSNMGLITGVPIQDTVDQLMELSAVPREMLKERTEGLRKEQTAISTLAGLVYATKISINSLGKESTYDGRTIASTHPDALSASITGDPAIGSYQFTPLQTAQSQKMLSSGFRSSTDPIGSGTISVRFGDHVQRDAPLNLLNEGQGISRGQIRIVDRSGAFANIDLSTAQSVDDVLNAINSNDTVNVTATTDGGAIQLIDNTGQTTSNLQVFEVGGGRTAESLGLGNVDVAADTATGNDIYRLFSDIDLADLNDGAGVSVDTVLPDIQYTLADGTTGNIDFSVAQGDDSQEYDVTLGDIVKQINEQTEGKLQAEIAADGRRLQLTDTTSGTGELALTALHDSKALADLGLATEAVGGVITGGRLIGGLRTVSLSSLNGGRGLGTLGSIELTDRGGTTDTVDLSGAETLEEVVDLLNTASVNIRTQINEARNGIELIDHSGGTGNLVVANADDTNTADALQIAADTSISTINSGDMHLQVISESTRLDSLNGGAGVSMGRFKIVDSTGRERTIDLNMRGAETIGDVVTAINRSHLGAQAEINETGDGILLRDTAGGSGTLQVREAGGTTAADLGLLGKGETVDVEGDLQQHIDGSMTHTIAIGSDDSLADLQQQINALGAGFSAGMVADGSTRPWHLTISSDRTGKAGSLVIDTSRAGFRFDEVAEAQDAMLGYGPASATASGIIATSSDNSFKELVGGLSLEMGQATGQTVTVEVGVSWATLTASAKNLVENYNKFRDELKSLTAYNSETNKGATLMGNNTALRMDLAMTKLATSRFDTDSRYRSLEEIGIEFNDTGKLSFNEAKFNAALAEDPKGVEEFFRSEDTGVADRFASVIEQLAGEDSYSLISQRIESLDRKIADNEERIEAMNASLKRERERMLTDFYNMELAVSRIQENLTALDSIAWITQQNNSNSNNSNN